MDSGGSAVLTLNNLATTVGRVSARYDRGASPWAVKHKVRIQVQFATAPVVGETVSVYIAESDGTDVDGDVGAADSALSTVNLLPNVAFVGTLVVQNTSADVDMTASWPVLIESRYFSVIVYNGTADNLKASANVSNVTVTPIYPDIQAAA